jgi:enterochelin esterase-like enzyme
MSSRPIPRPVGIESARLREFARACSIGGRARSERAWADLRRGGLPLVEPDPSAPERCLASFVWKPTRKVEAPSIYSPVVDLLHGEGPLRPLGSTGVWYRTLSLPRKVRAHYAFSPRAVPGMDADGPTWGRYFRGLVPDPWNPARIRIPFEVSVASLPDAPPQPWHPKRKGRTGGVFRQRLRSRILGDSRTVSVHLPARWEPDGVAHNLFIVFDGEAYTRVVPAPVIVENLVESGRISPTVLVLVGNATGARERELTYNSKFVDFLTEELLPWLRRSHHVATDGPHTLLAGSSLGGLTAAYAAFRNPDLFGNVLAQSGAFQALQRDRPERGPSVPTLMEQFAGAPLLPLRFYLDAGTFEGMPFPGMLMSPLAGVRYFRDVLIAKGYPVTYSEFEGGHDYACWAVTFADGVLALFQRPDRST